MVSLTRKYTKILCLVIDHLADPTQIWSVSQFHYSSKQPSEELLVIKVTLSKLLVTLSETLFQLCVPAVFHSRDYNLVLFEQNYTYDIGFTLENGAKVLLIGLVWDFHLHELEPMVLVINPSFCQMFQVNDIRIVYSLTRSLWVSGWGTSGTVFLSMWWWLLRFCVILMRVFLFLRLPTCWQKSWRSEKFLAKKSKIPSTAIAFLFG